MTESNTAAEHEMQQLGQKQGQQLDVAVARGSQWSDRLTKRGVEGKRLRDGGIKVSDLKVATLRLSLTLRAVCQCRQAVDSGRVGRGARSDLFVHRGVLPGGAAHNPRLDYDPHARYALAEHETPYFVC